MGRRGSVSVPFGHGKRVAPALHNGKDLRRLPGQRPFYFGHVSADEYFPAGSYEPIDIFRPDEAIDHICNCIDQQLDIQRTQQVEQARRYVLDELNIFPTLVRLLREKMVDGPRRNIRLYPKSQHVKLALSGLGRVLPRAA